MIFKVAYKKGDRISIKVNDNGKDIWMGCGGNVYDWCKKNFKDGDNVDVEYTENNGKYFATRVNSKGGASAPTEEKKVEQKAPATEKATSTSYSYPREYMKPKTPEEGRQMRACSILSSVCQAVQSLVGHVDPNNVGEIVESLYDRFDKKLP